MAITGDSELHVAQTSITSLSCFPYLYNNSNKSNMLFARAHKWINDSKTKRSTNVLRECAKRKGITHLLVQQ